MVEIEIAGKTILEWTENHLDTIIPDEVKNEVRKKFQEKKSKWEIAHKAMLGLTTTSTDQKCLAHFDKWRTNHPELRLEKQPGTGERNCAAMALHGALKKKSFLGVTVVDDKRAKHLLSEFYRQQGVGMVMTTPDLILLILNRGSVVTTDHARKAINEFFRNNPDTASQARKQGYISDINLCWRSAIS